MMGTPSYRSRSRNWKRGLLSAGSSAQPVQSAHSVYRSTITRSGVVEPMSVVFDLGPVDEDECHFAVMVGAVGPGVAGCLLDEHIATLHQRFVLVHHRPDLSVENDGVVEGRGC